MRKGRSWGAAATSEMSCSDLRRERSHAWAAPRWGQAGPARLSRAQRLSPGARGVTSQSRRVPPPEEGPRAGPGGPDPAGGRTRGWAGRGGGGAGRGPRCCELTVLLSPPKEMLQEKSLSETEEGFPTAPAPGHADSSAGSPVLGVAGGSSTPLSSPQLPDPEQVRTVRHRVLPDGFAPRFPRQPGRSRPSRDRASPSPTTPGGELRGNRIFLYFLFFLLLIHFNFFSPCRPYPPSAAAGR